MTDASIEVAKERALRSALVRLRDSTRFPVVFGGLVGDDGAVVVDVLLGNRGSDLDGLVVREGKGLGGRALAERRPRITSDYGTARTITHDYDRAVLGEGISTLMASPVLVDGRVLGVLWGGVHADVSIGDLSVGRAGAAADWLAQRLTDVDADQVRATGSGIDAQPLEELRASYAELRSIASSIDDPAIRARLEEVERRLLAVVTGDVGSSPSGASSGASPGAASGHGLSPREIDVLGHIALGRSNTETASRLGLRESTVKSYLVSAMSKLAASTRHEAVSVARRRGVLP